MNDHAEWLEANQRHLTASVGRLRALLERRSTAAAEEALREAEARLESAPALGRLVAAFELTPFERDVVLLAAAVELDGTFGAAVAACSDDAEQTRPNFGFALAVLPDAHWSALAPTAALRRWRLVDVEPGASLTAAALRIDERILHYLTGLSHLDERWAALVVPVDDVGALPPSHAAIAAQIPIALGALQATGAPLLVELTGNDAAGKRDVAGAVAASARMRLYAMNAADLSAAAAERELLARLWEREAILAGAALFIDAEELPPDARRNLAAFVDRIHTLLFLGTREPLHLPRARPLRFEVTKPTFGEQRDIWRAALGPAAAARLDGELDRLPSQFDLSARAIAIAAAAAAGGAGMASLWERCRVAARPRMQDLARRIEPIARWDDLVLPTRQLTTLREIVAHVRRRATVYEQWGFGATTRGLGISALFAGVSGTGKTMASEVLANELRLDLYQIDLSSVVSKYIGETEENLRRVFDAAEEGGAILLFDEADALFGKRTEVKDSHDRYANIEVSYLLQRMDAYRGVAILTTNLKSAIDSAFLRRLRFIIDFPFPDPAHRAEIWRRVFPPAAPLRDVDPAKLAKLNVAGGSIRNIALNAAFLAAEAGEAVGMAHILAAARTEYAKIDRPLTDSETGGLG